MRATLNAYTIYWIKKKNNTNLFTQWHVICIGFMNMWHNKIMMENEENENKTARETKKTHHKLRRSPVVPTSWVIWGILLLLLSIRRRIFFSLYLRLRKLILAPYHTFDAKRYGWTCIYITISYVQLLCKHFVHSDTANEIPLEIYVFACIWIYTGCSAYAFPPQIPKFRAKKGQNWTRCMELPKKTQNGPTPVLLYFSKYLIDLDRRELRW